MNDIVERLRLKKKLETVEDVHELFSDAAEEIERLREALRKIAALKDHPGLIADDIADDADAIARSALEEKKT